VNIDTGGLLHIKVSYLNLPRTTLSLVYRQVS